MTLDLETTTLSPWHGDILLIAYRFDGGPVQQIRVYENEKPNDEFLAALADPTVTKRGHHCSFDLLYLSAKGFIVKGPIDDSRLLAYLENPSQELGLKVLVEKKLHRKPVRLEDLGSNRLTKELKNNPNVIKSGNIYITDRPKFEEYNRADVINCDDLRNELIETKWYREVEQPLARILFEAEARGIQLDIPYLENLKNEFTIRVETLKRSLGEFNPNSPKQVKEAFQKAGVNLDSTDKYQLKQLAWKGNDLARTLLEYRKISKLLNTYVDPFIKQSVAGRLHGRFNQAGRESANLGDIKGTATGRLSSSDPNLQNIPDRTEEGKKVRKAIIATPGYVLIDSDLKQIEPRLIAHYSQSKVLLNAYEKGLDTHAIMGGLIFNKRPETLTKLERFIGKTSWLATVYGCYHKKLKQIVELNSEDPVPYDEEFYKKIQDSFWQANPEIKNWRDRHITTARNMGYVTTVGERIIKIPSINSKNKWERQEAERFSVNYQIQGSSADIMKMIIVNLAKYPDIKLLATIHDEVLMEVQFPYDLEMVEPAEDLSNVYTAMVDSVRLNNVPIEADTKIIGSWAEK